MKLRLGDRRGEVYLFLAAVCCSMFGQSIVDAVFNNFLNDTFALTSLQRSLLEAPRELPGLLVIVVAALLFFMCNRTLAAFSQVLAAAGIALIGTASFGFPVMLVWLAVFSTGQHLSLALFPDIGMELARDGQHGRRLGQISGVGNAAGIAGSLAVLLGFEFLGLTFTGAFLVAAASFAAAAALIAAMSRNKPVPVASRFTLRSEYRLYYWLTVLYGTRKQIFMTFAPWVLVTVFHRDVKAIATLLMIGGVIGIGFKPLLGRWIDRFGERAVLTGEAVALIFVCLGYGFAGRLFGARTALAVASACYVADQLLMSVGMARATYLRKIAVSPAEVTSTLTMGVTIDHVFSISVALLGGAIWQRYGYEWIFLLGAGIAVVNLFSARFVKTPA